MVGALLAKRQSNLLPSSQYAEDPARGQMLAFAYSPPSADIYVYTGICIYEYCVFRPHGRFKNVVQVSAMTWRFCEPVCTYIAAIPLTAVGRQS